ncbi:MAG: hypothetical protein ACFCUN_09255, partial [Hyphomicrobiaceae bacterium]
GRYQVRATADLVDITQEVAIESGRQTRLIVDLNAAQVTFVPRIASTDVAAPDAALMLTPLGTVPQSVNGSGTVWAGFTTRRDILVPAGPHVAVATISADITAQLAIDLKAGDRRTVIIPLEMAQLEVVTTQPDRSLVSPATVAILRDTGTAGLSWQAAIRSVGTTLVFNLPPGRYRIEAANGGLTASRDILLETGDQRSVSLALGAGRLALSTRLPDGFEGRDFDYVVRADAGQGGRAVRHAGPDAVVELAPGRYVIESRVARPRSTATLEVSVASQDEQEIEVVHNVGRVRASLDAGPSQTRPTSRPAVWSVVERGSETIVARDIGSTAEFLLPPGNYTVIGRGIATMRRDIEVQSGQTLEITLSREQP